MLSQLGRDLSTAEQRILDHRAFVNGEINNFLNEFELKRNEAEVETLFKVTEIIGDVKYDLHERCINLSTSHLGELNQEVNNLLVGVESFLNKVELQKQPNEYLIQSRKDREHKRANFLIDLEHKYERVKNSFEEKEEEIDELYSDLQLEMTKISIADTRVRLRPTLRLLQLIEEHKDTITEIPENIAKVLKENGFHIENSIELLGSDSINKEHIDLKLLRRVEELLDEDVPKSKSPEANHDCEETKETKLVATENFLYLSDIRWLKLWLTQLREKKLLDIFLHDLIDTCRLYLPMNEVIERNPELEARCQRLREQQQNKEYLDMTKNVDSTLKHVPEDTIAYQVKAMNSQMIAVLQFIFSVAAGFVFGFVGLELIFGGIEFGLRLVLGIFCALVIGVAEMYFLLKKLNEEEKAISSLKKSTAPVKKNEKMLKLHSE